jgi:isopenicillin N synthase-like dioxygenase
MSPTPDGLPIIDLQGGARALGRQLDRACREQGFFYVTGHGVEPALTAALVQDARTFFSWPVEQKLQIAMARGGRAWRGYFPVGGELTSGRPDRKEGLYFGTELGPADVRVRAGLPLHGANLFPDLPGFRERALTYMDAVTAVGQELLSGIAAGLSLPHEHFRTRYTGDPTVLFRIFNYPPGGGAEELGVGEHTDYGFLTLLWQDETGGLEVFDRDRWRTVSPVPGSLVCNVGDMLERLTAGRYVSALHRACNRSRQERISMPLFLDPGFDAVLEPLRLPADSLPTPNVLRARDRWDGLDLTTLQGTYGDYLVAKVSKVFPALRDLHLAEAGRR